MCGSIIESGLLKQNLFNQKKADFSLEICLFPCDGIRFL